MRRTAGVCCLLAACVASAPKDADTDATDTDAADTDAETEDTDDTGAGAVDTDVADTDSSPGCVLGTGFDVLTPLTPGGEARVVHGSQGRWHVYGAVSCTGVEAGGSSGSSDFDDLSNPDNPVVDWQILDTEGQELAGYQGLHRPMETGHGAGLLGEYLVFWTTPYADAVNRDATMTFHLVDKHGVTIDLSVPIRLVPEDGWVEDTDEP